MMNRYLATFKVPAEVIVQFEVSALSQQEGIVAAHDHILTVTADSAKIEKLLVGGATNTAFELISANTGPNSNSGEQVAPVPQGLTLQLFPGRDCEGKVLQEFPVLSLEHGKRLLVAAFNDPLTTWGSGRILDDMGLSVFSISASRGGWEVEAYESRDATDLVLKERATWLSSRGKALEVAGVLVSRGYSLKIYDFNDREAGPLLWRRVG